MSRVAVLVVLVLAVTVSAQARPGAAPSAGTAPRADRVTTDRPDEVTGPQVHLVYAVPSDATDRGYDTNGAVAKSFALAQAWLSDQTGGQVLRLDTFKGEADVTFLRLSETGPFLLSGAGREITAIATSLRATGFPDTKAYLVYLEAGLPGARGCDGVVGRAGAMRIGGNQLKNPVCAQVGGQLGEGFFGMAGVWEFGILHEFIHTLGIIAPCSPHVTDLNKLFDPTVGHSNDNGGGQVDVMAAPEITLASLGSRVVLDINHDDYYKAGISGCPDLATSGFLAAPSAKSTRRLTVSVTGAGGVASVPTGISCPTRCSAAFPLGTTVRLIARAASGWKLRAFSGACTGRTCSVALRANASVRVAFVRK